MPTDFQQLLQKFLTNSLTKEEQQLFISLAGEKENEPVLQSAIDQAMEQGLYKYEDDHALRDLIYARIEGKIEEKPATKVVRINWLRTAVAAAVIGLVALSGWYFFIYNKKTDTPIVSVPVPPADIIAGKGGGILTLGNGSKIVLDSAGNGELTKEGMSTVVKNGNEISYKVSGAAAVNEIVYNTMTTPKGRTFSLVLPDGSKIWLNAESSVRFPSSFSGNERKVSVTGEAYFEVAKNTSMPFRVEVKDMIVEVLGTHFNINAYTDEAAIKTTLIEGAVKVIKGNQTLRLSPGQQSIADNSGLSLGKSTNLDEVIAWKDGYFHFENAELPVILRQFSRWYDVHVVYEGVISTRKFFGVVKRSNTLRQVLVMLQDNKIDYRIEGNKLIVRSQ